MKDLLQQELPGLTELLADCPASLTRSQEIDRAVKTLAHYSPTISDYCGAYDPDLQSLRMSQDYSQLTMDGNSEEYLAPMPKSGMMLAGKLYRVPKLGDLISGSDSLLLLTPVKSDATVASCITNKMQFRLTKNGTPRKISNNGVDGSQRVCADRRLTTTGEANASRGLTRFIKLLPTPKYSDRLTAGVKATKPGQTKHLASSVNKLDPKPGLLNPEFVERLMGFPVGWTARTSPRIHSGDSALTKSAQLSELASERTLTNTNNSSVGDPELLKIDCLNDYLDTALDTEEKSDRRIRLGQLGNAVVPQVVAIVFDILDERLKANGTVVKALHKQLTIDDVAELLFPQIESVELLGEGKYINPSNSNNGYLQIKQKERGGKIYKEHYYRYYEGGRQRSLYVKNALISKVRGAIASGEPIEEILKFLGLINNPHSQASLNKSKGGISKNPRNRKKGKGNAYIETKQVTKKGKLYTEYWFHYESGGSKRSKYIPKSKCDRISQMNGNKLPVNEILKAIATN